MDRAALNKKMEKDRRDGNVSGLLRSYREGNLEEHLGSSGQQDTHNNSLEHATLARPAGPKKSKSRPKSLPKSRPKSRQKPKFGVLQAASVSPEAKKVVLNTPSATMKRWVNNQIDAYPVKQAANFTSSWQDGAILTALVDSMRPGICPLAGLRPGNNLYNIQRAMDVAEKELGVPPIMEANDMAKNPDNKSCMTYVSYFTKIDAKAKAAPAARSMKATASEFNDHRAEGQGARSFVTKKSLENLNISPTEKKIYDLMFKFLDKDKTGKIRGDRVKPILMSSNLPRKDLQTVWRIADLDNSGELSREEFYICMKLIALAQQGQPISLKAIAQSKDTTVAAVDLGHGFELPKDEGSNPKQKRPSPPRDPKPKPGAASSGASKEKSASFRGSFGHRRGFSSKDKSEEKTEAGQTNETQRAEMDHQGRENVDLSRASQGTGQGRRKSSKFAAWGKAFKSAVGTFDAEAERDKNAQREKLCPECSTMALVHFPKCKDCGYVFGGIGLKPRHQKTPKPKPPASSTHMRCPDCGSKCPTHVAKCPDCRYKFK